jgi:hypothetical protein
MKKTLVLILLISLLACKEKNTLGSNLVTDIEVYNVIDFIIKNEFHIKGSEKSYISEEFPIPLPNVQYFGIDELTEIFSKKDIEFMKLQLDQSYAFRINERLIKVGKIISFDSLGLLYKENERSDKFWKRFEKKYKAHKFYGVSLPIFSVDLKTVMVSYGNHCGSLCGSGQTVIYKKKNGKWKQIKTISFWVS